MKLKEKYKEQSGRSPFVFDKKGRIKENFSYTDGYVSWLENQINSNKQIAEDFTKGFAKWCRSGTHNEKFTEKSISLNDLLEIYKKEKGL